MKRLDELGISPTPWHTFNDNWVESADGNPAMSNAAYACNQNDARIFAAATELYECLREAAIEVCHNFTCCGSSEDGYACHGDRECFVKRWRAALAKASGEEVKA